MTGESGDRRPPSITLSDGHTCRCLASASEVSDDETNDAVSAALKLAPADRHRLRLWQQAAVGAQLKAPPALPRKAVRHHQASHPRPGVCVPRKHL